MSRPSHVERGARMAFEAAARRLGVDGQRDLFPVKFKRGERALWESIHAAAADELADISALRGAARGR